MLIGYVDRLLGRSSSSRSRMRDDRRPRSVSLWALLAAVLLAFVGGFLLGGRLAPKAGGDEALNASGVPGRNAGFVGENDTRKLSPTCYVVALYPASRYPDAQAFKKASELAGWLRGHRIERAQPSRFPTKDGGSAWGVACYYDGESEAEDLRRALRGLPQDAEDEIFTFMRKKDATDWPIAYRFQ